MTMKGKRSPPMNRAVAIALLAIGVAGVFTLGMGLALWLWPWPAPKEAPTAALTVIAQPTWTPTPSPTPTSLAHGTPTPIPPLAPGPGEIAVGRFVQVSGTGGDGLRLRTAPGLQAPVRFLAREAEVFRVADGPQPGDGYTWWYLVAPYDPQRAGWAVANYLSVLPGTPQP